MAERKWEILALNKNNLCWHLSKWLPEVYLYGISIAWYYM